jgi:hypothetical protein
MDNSHYRFEKIKDREDIMHNIIEARMELYLLFPDKITEISSIFQKWGLE